MLVPAQQILFKQNLCDLKTQQILFKQNLCDLKDQQILFKQNLCDLKDQHIHNRYNKFYLVVDMLDSHKTNDQQADRDAGNIFHAMNIFGIFASHNDLF
jgi:hypothetical protein